MASKHYINNKTFYEEMKKFKAACAEAKANGTEPPIIPRYIGECFLQICNKLSTKPNFVGYTYRDEMISDAIENCVMSVYGFDPDKSANPFAYFTQISWNAFIRRIGKEKKQQYIKHKNFHQSMLFHSGEEGMQPDENSYEVIKSFEEKLAKKVKVTVVDEDEGIEKFFEVIEEV